jgi:hypothetical protein
MGAGMVVGLDIRDSDLNSGRMLATDEQVADRCLFLNAGGAVPLCRTGQIPELFTSVVKAHLVKP